MTLPSAETARNWSGLTAVDSDEQPLGRITDIYLDYDTGQPEWALVATAQRGRRSFVPLAGAARKGDRVTVAVPKAAVGDAPAVRPPGAGRAAGRLPGCATPPALGTWLRRPAGLAALTFGSPPSQRLVVEVIEKRRQQLSGSQELLGDRQSGMETPRQLLRRRVALARGDPTEHYVHISCLHRRPHSFDRRRTADGSSHPASLSETTWSS